MKGKLMTWLKAGYPCLKEQSGLPPWIMPQHRFSRLADEVGDDGILAMARPLGVAAGVEGFLFNTSVPEAESEAWRAASLKWPRLVHVEDMVEACLETTGLVMNLFNNGRLMVAPEMVCRGMLALSFAPFLPEGLPLLVEIAPVLKGEAGRPGDMLRRYGGALAQGDMLTAQQVDLCIAEHSRWAETATASLKVAAGCPYVPKPIGITPPASPEMTTILSGMLREEMRC